MAAPSGIVGSVHEASMEVGLRGSSVGAATLVGVSTRVCTLAPLLLRLYPGC